MLHGENKLNFNITDVLIKSDMFYSKIRGNIIKGLLPSSEEAIKFWVGIWGCLIIHEKNVGWHQTIKTDLDELPNLRRMLGRR